MVKVEIERPEFHTHGDDVAWKTVASLTVDGSEYELDDPYKLVNFDRPVLDPVSGRRLSWQENTEDREDWARHLPSTYRGPEVVAVVVSDSHPAPAEDPLPAEPVSVPETSQKRTQRRPVAYS
jgi:hypothetical protein